ncbi:MarR family transcriptional regulator [Desertihabitans brevis]|uniref:MarR family transcriptional regulator n=2 Tax=Desertihabitans brevis TaxID=2268447 RepID=A0A367YRQ8_9ACTN|nr:MarR family transcriptional regulator [Desertihabitans brevis]
MSHMSTAHKASTDGPAIAARVRRVQVISDKVQRRLARLLEVNPTDLTAMEHLLESGPMTASELASRMQMSTAATTHVIDRLSRAGHVRRAAHPSDRRKIRVETEPEAVERAMVELRPIIAGVVQVASARSAEERAVIASFLDDVSAFYASLLEEPER